MQRVSKYLYLALLYTLLASLQATVHAQSVDLTDNYNLGYRSHEKSDPYKLGSFKAGGSVGSAVGYDDNVHETPDDKRSGAFVQTDAFLWINSDWERHALNISAYGSQSVYPDNNSEDEYYANIFTYGRLDLPSDVQFELISTYQFDEDPRGDPRILFNPSKTSVDQEAAVKAFLSKGFGKAAITVRGGVTYSQHEDTTSNLGLSLQRDDDDSILYDVRLRGSFNFGERLNAYVEGGYNRWDFERETDRNGIQRGSQGGHVAAGLLFQPNNKISGEIAVGYRHQQFRDPGFSDSGALTLDAWVTWAVTDRFNLSAVADTRFEEDSIFGQAGTLSRSLTLQADYRVHDRLRLFTSGYYLYEDNIGSSLDDQTLIATIGFDYELYSRLVLTGKYEYEYFDAGFAGGDYDANRVQLGLKLTR
ncbi:outer membrane beta-barrel protein [Coralliovum pocilloporae]|uniref:outer membrane beta-barrel protein n=1 Tax=Coralliovum pocilloporae TaxID=3066369 RepID=UPI003306A7E9